MKVIPLGTSSGKPTLKRNVSALAVVREGEWLLFDCGEGTQMQVARAGLSPNRLSAVFITHLHGDHFNGLAGLLSSMGLDRRERPLTVVAPHGVREYFETLERLKIVFVNYPLDLREMPRNTTAATVCEAEDYVVTARALDHRIFALGYRVEEKPRPGRFNLDRALELGVPEGPMFGRLQSGEQVQLKDGRVIRPSEVLGPPRPGSTVSYCLDTRPCQAATDLGRDADLLVHEATYTSDLAREAREYGHSTAAEAAETARASGARRLLLTHFSTRYSDASALLEEARAIFPATELAQELVEIEV